MTAASGIIMYAPLPLLNTRSLYPLHFFFPHSGGVGDGEGHAARTANPWADARIGGKEQPEEGNERLSQKPPGFF